MMIPVGASNTPAAGGEALASVSPPRIAVPPDAILPTLRPIAVALASPQPIASAAPVSTLKPATAPTWQYGPPLYVGAWHLTPAASVTPIVRLSVAYTYTATGYLEQLSNAVNGEVYWSVGDDGALTGAMDAFGSLLQETYGNGVVSEIAHADPEDRITGITSGLNGGGSLQDLGYHWDALGNLLERSDGMQGTSEGFEYDVLNRLISAQVTNSSGVQPAVTYAYNALGNLTSKSDTGTYTYGQGAGPHAVTSIVGPAGGTYSYDADGNMTDRNGTVIEWNSENRPVDITEDGNNSSSFSYAPDGHRYDQNALIDGVSETTVYVGDFEAISDNGAITYRHHLMAYGREVAEVDLSNSGSGGVTETVSYILTDHLGSVDMVTNSSGTPVAEMSFSAFGQRRDLGPGSTLWAQRRLRPTMRPTATGSRTRKCWITSI